ncbi:MAG: hypothetical protein JRJ87_25195 [Deltaproteobacteria bacterium]|nr:hypothetical protein [Deltaproteobacteria bacterium]
MKRFVVFILPAFLFGCSGTSNQNVCEPGQQQNCTCPNETIGQQTCFDDGSKWGDCQCPCLTDCTYRECGPDPVCGVSCGTCPANSTCDDFGSCECHFARCGYSCCGIDQVCFEGFCCTPECGLRVCGPDPVCSESCGTCGDNSTCSASGLCECDFETCADACCPDGRVCHQDACCTPECGTRMCGPDPVCESSCGDCGANEDCTLKGECIEDCTPACGSRVCGPDPVCWLSCGDCAEDAFCTIDGLCVPNGCAIDCSGLVCGPDPNCDAICGYCGPDETCNAAGQCEGCTPNCTGKECGSDGCEGFCGICEVFEYCNLDGLCECAFTECNGSCCANLEVCHAGYCCAPDCTNRECGLDPVCSEICGTCADLETCNLDGLCECAFAECNTTCCAELEVCHAGACCAPDCTNRECGPDPVCGESCGTCTSPLFCLNGQCVDCIPDCTNRECGHDPVCNQSCGTCDTGWNCDNGACIPTPECTLESFGSECAADQACIINDLECTEFRCYFTNANTEGSPCQYSNDCQNGLLCRGSPGSCTRVCVTNDDCVGAVAGPTCMNIESCPTTWGVCATE